MARPLRNSLIALLALCGACGTRAATRGGPPPIEPVAGQLMIDVVYPPRGSLIAAGDSNFIFGSVGNGGAELTIDGHPVPVKPNGAFLAWLPVPAVDDTLARYLLVVRLGDRVERATHPVRLSSRPPGVKRDSVGIDAASLTPRGTWWVREGEVVPVRVRATPGAKVRVALPDSSRVELSEVPAAAAGAAANWIFGQLPLGRRAEDRASGIYEGTFMAGFPLGRAVTVPDLSPVPGSGSGVSPYCSPPAVERAGLPEPQRDSELETPTGCAVVEVVLGGDTARALLPLDLWVMGGSAPWVSLRAEPSGLGSRGYVVGRAAPGATTLWLWSDGVTAPVSGRRNGSVRIVLDRRTEAWVSAGEVRVTGRVEPFLAARAATVRFVSQPDEVVARISLSRPVPYDVHLEGERLTLLLYGAYSDTDWLQYGPEDPFLVGAKWEQVSSDRYALHIELAEPVWGYDVRYGEEGLTLHVRKPPNIDSRRPLWGITIAVDAGHPPGGATGPTRLTEADANLAVAARLQQLLEAQGAKVVSTRSDRSSVRIYDRTRLADWVSADVLISVHNNALPDGVNPFERHGTSVYYFHPHSRELARALQRGLLQSMGLRDLGIGRSSLALVRPTWMPAALTEGAFMMIPEQEAGLQHPEFVDAYARGVVAGLSAFLRARAE